MQVEKERSDRGSNPDLYLVTVLAPFTDVTLTGEVDMTWEGFEIETCWGSVLQSKMNPGK